MKPSLLLCGASLFLVYATFPAPESAAEKLGTEPPAGQHAILTADGRGVQIYTCTQTASGPAWTFTAPEADLLNEDGQRVGTHSAGPTWTYKDGSAVHGVVEVNQPAPKAARDIPWLLLRAKEPSAQRAEAGSGASSSQASAAAERQRGGGFLGQVSYIQRSQTHGGVAPRTGCDADHLSTVARVRYSATYTFYTPSR